MHYLALGSKIVFYFVLKPLMEIKEHNTAGCYLIRNGNSGWEIVLLYKKWATDNQGWNPPKGHVEAGETLEAAAIRETAEETGYLDMEILTKLGVLNLEYPWEDGFLHRKSIHYYLAKLKSELKAETKLSQQEENSTIRISWLTLKEAEKQLQHDDERELLKKAIEFLQNNPS